MNEKKALGVAMEFKGKIAVITGGAGGVGAPTSLKLAQGGAHVVIVDQAIEQGRAVAREIAAAGGSAEAI
jgi:NAD(P)-dependent dehydrogenase (short-subunit alcohol dehydrogenase family)